MIEASRKEISTASKSLARAIVRRCRGKTLVLGREFPDLMSRLESQGIEALARRPDDPAESGETFDTIVLVRAVEFEERENAEPFLKRAWAQVGPRGKLLVCAPNEDYQADADQRQRFTRRGLKQLLKAIDQPKVFTDQPLRWLLMAVDSDPRVDRPTEERHRVIAGLCRGAVLELGCAAGHLCGKIAEGGLTVSGLDKNAAKIAKARRLFPDIDFAQADILKLALQRRYDTVILAEVIEHVPDDVGAAMLAKAWELVAPHGRLIVSVPNEDCVRHANHLREFDRRDLGGLLEPFGTPRIVADQPFRWLLMYIDRSA